MRCLAGHHLFGRQGFAGNYPRNPAGKCGEGRVVPEIADAVLCAGVILLALILVAVVRRPL